MPLPRGDAGGGAGGVGEGAGDCPESPRVGAELVGAGGWGTYTRRDPGAGLGLGAGRVRGVARGLQERPLCGPGDPGGL